MARTEDRRLVADKVRRVINLLQTAVEVHNGGFRVESVDDDAAVSIAHVHFALSPSSPTMKGIIVNGDLFIAAIDAGIIDGRNRARMTAVARRVSDA